MISEKLKNENKTCLTLCLLKTSRYYGLRGDWRIVAVSQEHKSDTSIPFPHPSHPGLCSILTIFPHQSNFYNFPQREMIPLRFPPKILQPPFPPSPPAIGTGPQLVVRSGGTGCDKLRVQGDAGMRDQISCNIG